MSRLQEQRTNLTAQRDGQRNALEQAARRVEVAESQAATSGHWGNVTTARQAHDQAANALRQTESELASVQMQLAHGPGARAVIAANRSKAAFQERRTGRAPETPTPARLAPGVAADGDTATPAKRYSWQDDTDVAHSPAPSRRRTSNQQNPN